MNRLQSRAQSHLQTASNRTRCHLSEKPLTLDFHHRLFTPEHYEQGYAYPLVLWLHSDASSEYELDGLMPHLSLRNYVALAIRGTQLSQVSERRFQWGNASATVAAAEEMVLEAVESVSEKLSINRQKVFLAGHGAGGTLAQWLGLRHSQTFAGVVSIHGGFPRRPKSLVHWKAARSLPVLFMYGEQSEICDTDEVCRSLRHVHSAGLRYQFAQFPGGDVLDSAMTETANRFMMDLVLEQSSSTLAEISHEEQTAVRFDED